MKPVTVPLTYPFEHKGREYAEVTVRRPKVRDMIEAERMADRPYAQDAAVAAIVSGIDFTAMGEMDAEDLDMIMEKSGLDFLRGGGRRTDAASPSSPSPDTPTGGSTSS